MNTKRLFLILLLAAGLAVSGISTAQAAPPPIPCKVYGSVKLDGENVPAGTWVSAWINDVEYARAQVYFYNGVSNYTITIPGDDLSTTDKIEGGRKGDIIRFQISDTKASPTVGWESGKTINLNISNISIPVYFPLILGNSLP